MINRSLLALIVAAASAGRMAFANESWFFEMNDPVVVERLDPIVSPNAVASHMHRVFGGSGFKAAYDYDALSTASCTNAAVKGDKSNYWVPQMYWQNKDNNGTTTSYTPIPAGTRIYYQIITNAPDGKVHPFPKGLRMLTGSPDTKTPTENLSFGRWVCQVPGVEFENNLGGSDWNFAHDCPGGLKVEIRFPPCWDGVNLYLSDNSHVAFPNEGEDINPPCPVTHPIRMPSIQFEIVWHTSWVAWEENVAGNLVWANGDTTSYGIHADFINGWDDTLAKALEDPSCFGFGDSVPFGACGTFNSDLNPDADSCTKPDAGVMQESFGNVDNVAIPSLPGCNPLWGQGPKPTCPSVNNPDVAPFTGTNGPLVVAADQRVNNSLPTTPGWHDMYCIQGSQSLVNQTQYYDDGLSLESCRDSCLRSGKQWASVGPIPGWSCFCGDGLDPSAKQTSGCTSQCPGQAGEICGGDGLTSVSYAPAGTPSPNLNAANGSLGCYQAAGPDTSGLQGKATYTFQDWGMTQEMCKQSCGAKGNAWAAITYGSYCYCGNDFDFSPGFFLPDDFCWMGCSSNPAEMCGGSGIFNVFTTGVKGNTTATTVSSTALSTSAASAASSGVSVASSLPSSTSALPSAAPTNGSIGNSGAIASSSSNGTAASTAVLAVSATGSSASSASKISSGSRPTPSPSKSVTSSKSPSNSTLSVAATASPYNSSRISSTVKTGSAALAASNNGGTGLPSKSLSTSSLNAHSTASKASSTASKVTSSSVKPSSTSLKASAASPSPASTRTGTRLSSVSGCAAASGKTTTTTTTVYMTVTQQMPLNTRGLGERRVSGPRRVHD